MVGAANGGDKRKREFTHREESQRGGSAADGREGVARGGPKEES